MNKSKYNFTDEEYGKVLDNFVIACVDVAVIHENMILLEKRRKQPDKDGWWIFGGRVNVREDLLDTARRGLQRELGLEVNRERFFKMSDYNLIWPIRREPKKENGCNHLLLAHGIILDKIEYLNVNNYIKNHNIDARWFSINNPEKDLTEKNILLIIEECRALLKNQ